MGKRVIENTFIKLKGKTYHVYLGRRGRII